MARYSVNQKEGRRITMKEGIERRNLVVGSQSMLCEFHLEKGSELPLHHHPQEQAGYLIAGRLHFDINGDLFTMEAGDSWSIGADVPHQVKVLETAVLIESFTPIRKDFLEEES